MAQETFVLTALPITAAKDATAHVSLHIAPRLTGDATHSRLGQFELFAKWAARAAGLKWRLLDGAGKPIAADALVDRIQPDLWPRIFPRTTPVQSPRFDAMANRDWRSFPAKAVHDLAVATALYGTMLFPLDPPAFHPKRRGEQDRLDQIIRMLANEEAATRQLEAIAANPKLGRDQPLLRALVNLQQVRRFYERPEAQRERQPEPTEGLAHEPLAPPKPDFHERVAHLADQPRLLRMLGLVIDLRVTDLDALAKAKELRAAVDLPDAQVIRPRTPVLHPGSGRLITRPRTGGWHDGKLPLGGDDFEVLALDTDGSALKLERYVRSLPRMQAVAENGDPGNAAPPAQRSEGFTIVRTGRLGMVRDQLQTAEAMVAAASSTAPPVIATEDVTRGYRIDIWDDQEKAWFSPHLRLATARLADGTVIYADQAERGAIQTAAASTVPGADNGSVYLHEALFGWSGWSLSAPRPGPRAVPDGRKEKVVPAEDPADPIIPVLVTTRAMPGTLPRLRYGRSYAFRAWSVDLAGNSPGDPIDIASHAVAPKGDAAPATTRLGRDGEEAFARPEVRPARLAVNQMPEIARAANRISERLGTVDLNGDAAALATVDARTPATPRLTGIAERDRDILHTLRTRAAARAAPASTGAGVAGLLRDALPGVSLEQVIGGGVPKQIDNTTSPLMPFRRWDPVPPPVVVARHRFSMAESVRHMVIRSGVAPADPASDTAPVVTPPGAYLADVADKDPIAAQDWRATSERHLAAPKGSQHLNELHGRFDAAMGDRDQASLMLATALREDGTFFDDAVVDLTNPMATVPQPGISLEAGPEVTGPPVVLASVTGDNRGEALAPNHYVIHDTDQLRLPYLPDPLAAGVALGMVGANRDSPLLLAFRVESTAARYSGAWPEPEPYRLLLESAAQPTARVDGNVITIGLPPGGRLDLDLSSSLRRQDLDLFALWNLLPKALRTLDLIERPAADGQFWALTPPEQLSLVHAVPRPVLPPLINWLVPLRAPAATSVDLLGAVDAHAASTGRIDIEASWWEWRDDPAAPGPVHEQHHAAPAHATIHATEDLVLWGGDLPEGHTIEVMEVGRVPVHRARHEFGDTRARVVDYRMRGTTRFGEYFPQQLMQKPEDRSQLSAPRTLSLPSTARPPAPRVHSTIPLFRWDEGSDPGQPFGVRRRRRSGIRIYLERPWYQSGDEERLAVLFGSAAYNDAAHTSVWGSDPLWVNQGPPDQFVGLALEDAYTAVDLDPVRGHDQRVGPPASTRLVDVKGNPTVSLLGYRPDYNEERRLWYVDVAIEPAAAVWPFVRLAIARYQPNALAGLALSPVVLTDFCQLPPERTMTVSRPDEGSARVTVSGPIGLRASELAKRSNVGAIVNQPPVTAPLPDLSANYPLGKADITNVVAQDRRMFAVLEHRPAGQTSDLAWQRIKFRELSIGGVSPAKEWAWTGVLDLADPLPLAAPGGAAEWRITVEEREGLEADPVDPNTAAPLTKAWRIVYADQTLL